jgi:hypothetical protein
MEISEFIALDYHAAGVAVRNNLLKIYQQNEARCSKGWRS